MSSTHLRRALGLALVAAVGAAAVVSAATSASADPTSAGKAKPATITAFLKGNEMGFKGPGKVKSGADLRIVSTTDPEKVGPHTFTLVKKRDLPETNKEMKDCEKLKSDLCKDIAKAHKANPENGTVKKPDVDVGKKGWDRSFGKKGDTWFVAQKGESTERRVTAKPGTTLHYFCVIHPFMQGKIKVVK